MTGTFTIEVDRPNTMLMITAHGFWSADTVRAFLAAERSEIASLGVHPRELLILFDASHFAVQSQEVIDMLRRPEHPLYNARRAAFVAPPGLATLQIKRGTPEGHIGVLETLPEARAYLMAG